MSQAPIMPFFTDAYLADTHHLSTEAHGAYLLLLLYSWRCNGAPPPDDDAMLARITKLSARRWRNSMRAQLEPFYRIEGGLWHQKRLEKTWDDVQRKIDSQRHKAMKGNWMRKQRGNALSNQQSAPAAAKSQSVPSHKPSTDQPSTSLEIPAIDSLKPILNDVQYFVPNGKRVSGALRVQIDAALVECESWLAPMGLDMAEALVARLWRMFPSRDVAHAAQSDYSAWFARYPADLCEEAYGVLLEQHRYPSVPKIADFVPHVQPQMQYRQLTQQRLHKLHAQLEPQQ
ncbi:MAG: DUF1376 domain-containing protein [Rickettsiales bacterium]|nr:DUF1376 domain-containing protein [Rickettsiales bacterium]